MSAIAAGAGGGGPEQGTPQRLVGARHARGGPVVYADPWGLDVMPGQAVVIDGGEGETLALVVVGTAQVVDVEPPIKASVRVRRLATDDDILMFGRRSAEALDALPAANSVLRGLSAQADAVDAWTAPDGARLFVACTGDIAQPELVARTLAERFGLPVDVFLVAADGSYKRVTEPERADLPADWAEWIAPPGADPGVSVVATDATYPSASDFIGWRFPLESREPPRERRPRRQT
ncbi:MAG: hypothetical protein GEU73_15795 [Chloroflexi bacterium]|nr:hypothetical protein [Chloroflexota bacterium]